MKKVMISLLMVAATLNAMAITYSGKVKVRLTSSDNQYCEAVVATSDELNDGLNNSYYAPFNDENKEVHLYVEFGGTRYAHFGSSAATMQNMPLIMKANSATSYTFTFSAMVGTIEIYDKEAGANIDKSQPYNFTIEDAQKNSIIADRFIINYVAPAPTGYTVTPNAEGYATFSAAEATVIPSGVTAVYRGVISGDELQLSAITGFVPANTGVIVEGVAGTDYNFAIASTSVPALSEANDLRPTSDYDTSMKNVFVLKGDAFLEYIGTTALKANKAFIQLPAQNGAPKRIRMVVNHATGVENAAVEVKAEKFVENGQVLIRRGNEVYNLQGQIVK